MTEHSVWHNPFHKLRLLSWIPYPSTLDQCAIMARNPAKTTHNCIWHSKPPPIYTNGEFNISFQYDIVNLSFTELLENKYYEHDDNIYGNPNIFEFDGYNYDKIKLAKAELHSELLHKFA